jgi:hypothetical protein
MMAAASPSLCSTGRAPLLPHTNACRHNCNLLKGLCCQHALPRGGMCICAFWCGQLDLECCQDALCRYLYVWGIALVLGHT